jgi:arylsulfatase A-like enzyme
MAVGAATGLALAAREISRQTYLPQGMERTALWLAAEGAAKGAAIGAACASAVMLLLFLRWVLRSTRSRRSAEVPQPQLEVWPQWAQRQTIALALLTGVALVLLPGASGALFGIPRIMLVIALLAVLWGAATALAARSADAPADRPDDRRWSRLRWLILVALAAAAVFLSLWERSGTWQALLIGIAVLCAASLAAFYGLRRPFHAVYERIAAPIGRALTGRAAGALAALVLLGAVGLWAAGGVTLTRAGAEAAERGHSVILIGIDTLRADCSSPPFSPDTSRELTPNITALGKRGIVFSKAIAQAPWTLASFASVYTGLYPDEHGAIYLTSTLAPTRITLAEILREAGYRTCGVVSGEYVAAGAGMAQGYEAFDETQVQGGTGISSKAVTSKAIDWLRDHKQDPFFMFLHYFDPHWIYQNHEEFDFADAYAGRLREPAATLTQSDFQDHVGITRPGFSPRQFPPEDLAYLRDLYREDVAYMDAALGRLFRFLDEEGLWDSCFVILVADHGEQFLERGKLGHNNSVHAEEIHVPLVIAGPSVQGGQVFDKPVETRSLFTTVLECTGVDPPAGREHPRSLLARDASEPAFARSAVYTTVVGVGGRMLQEPVECWWTSLQDERWKLIRVHLGGRSFLFDLAEDFGETRNCKAANEEVCQRLEEELARLDAQVRRHTPTGPAPEASAEQKRRLRALGYL